MLGLAAIASIGFVLWALVRYHAPRSRQAFVVGGSAGDVPSTDVAATEIVSATDQGVLINMAAITALGGLVNHTNRDVGHTPTQSFYANINDCISVGLRDFTLHFTGIAAQVPAVQPVLRLDARRAGYLVASAAAHAAVFLVASTIGSDAVTGGDDSDCAQCEPVRTLAVTQAAFEHPPEAVTEKQDGEANQSSMALAPSLSQQHLGTDGGDPAKKTSGAHGDSTNREEAVKTASSAGMLALITEDRLAGLIGNQAVMQGLGDAGLFQGLNGEGGPGGTFGTQFGGGRGMYGGAGEGIKVSGYAKSGIGDRVDFGYCTEVDCKGGLGRRHKAAVPTVTSSAPTIIGDYDRAMIRRYIKLQADKIQNCYERTLLAHPDLNGTIEAVFAINTKTGAVMTSNATGVHPEVSACVAAVIGNVQFPSRGAGTDEIVTVRYPFALRVAAK
jgi:hypothetical protein